MNVDLLPAKYRQQHFSIENKIRLENDTNGRFKEFSDIVLGTEMSPLLVDDESLRASTPLNTILVTAEFDILRYNFLKD